MALGGTGYATVATVPKKSVGTAELKRGAVGTQQLKRNAVKAAKLAPNAVRSAHVLNGSLLAVDFKEGQIPQGPKGDKGEKGDKGDPGAPAAAVWANLSDTGTIEAGKGATGASGTAPYTVTFDRDIANCAVVAAPAGPGLQVVVSGVIRNGAQARIYVISRSTGAFATARVSVAVFC